VGGSRGQALRERVEQTKERVDKLAQRSTPVHLTLSLITRPNYVNDTLLASYFAMRLFILLFPLAYMVVAGIGLYSSSASTNSDDVVTNVGLQGALAQSVAEASRDANRSHVVIFLGGLVLTVWAARAAMYALRIVHASVWRMPFPKKPLAELGAVGFAAVLVVVAWLGILTSRLRHEGAPIVLTSLVLAAIVGAGWWAISWGLPHTADRRIELLPGAILVGFGAPALNLATQLYFAPKLARSSDTYGVLGSSLVFLTYLIVVGWTIVLGAELNAGLHDWRNREQGSPAENAATR
jgi:membrane protein